MKFAERKYKSHVPNKNCGGWVKAFHHFKYSLSNNNNNNNVIYQHQSN